MIRKILLVTALAIVLFALAGCQTVQGLGRDITWTGEAVGGLFEGK
jgi:predicted small secreted protein